MAGIQKLLIGLVMLSLPIPAAGQIAAIDEARDRIVSIDVESGSVDTVVAASDVRGHALGQGGGFLFVVLNDRVAVIDPEVRALRGWVEVDSPQAVLSDRESGDVFIRTCTGLVQIDPVAAEVVRHVPLPSIYSLGPVEIVAGRAFYFTSDTRVASVDLATQSMTVSAERYFSSEILAPARVGRDDVIVVSDPYGLAVLAAGSLEQLGRVDTPSRILAATAAVEGEIVVVTDDSLAVIDLGALLPKSRVELQPDPYGVYLTARGNRFFTVSEGMVVSVGVDGRIESSSPARATRSFTLSPDGSYAVAIGYEELQVFVAGQVGPTVAVPQLRDVVWLPWQGRFAVLSRRGVSLLDPESGSLESVVRNSEFRNLVVARDGAAFVSEDAKPAVSRVDLDRGHLDDLGVSSPLVATRASDLAIESTSGALVIGFGGRDLSGVLTIGDQGVDEWSFEPGYGFSAAGLRHARLAPVQRVLSVGAGAVLGIHQDPAVLSMVSFGESLSVNAYRFGWEEDFIADVAYHRDGAQAYLATVRGPSEQDLMILQTFDRSTSSFAPEFSIRDAWPRAIALAPDGAELYVGVSAVPSGINRSYLAVIDSGLNDVLAEIEMPGEVLDLVVANDGTLIASVDGEPSLVFVDAVSRRVLGGVGSGLHLKSLHPLSTEFIAAHLPPVELDRRRVGDHEVIAIMDDYDGVSVVYPQSPEVRKLADARAVAIDSLGRVYAGIRDRDGKAHIERVDIPDGDRWRVRIAGAVRKILPSPDGEYLYVVNYFPGDGDTRMGFSVLETASASVIYERPIGSGFKSLFDAVLAPDGSELVLVFAEAGAYSLDTRTGEAESLLGEWNGAAFVEDDLFLIGRQGLYARRNGSLELLVDSPAFAGQGAGLGAVADPPALVSVVPSGCGSQVQLRRPNDGALLRDYHINFSVRDFSPGYLSGRLYLASPSGFSYLDLETGDVGRIPVSQIPAGVAVGCRAGCALEGVATIDWSMLPTLTPTPTWTARPTLTPTPTGDYVVPYWFEVSSVAGRPGEIVEVSVTLHLPTGADRPRHGRFDLVLPTAAGAVAWGREANCRFRGGGSSATRVLPNGCESDCSAVRIGVENFWWSFENVLCQVRIRDDARAGVYPVTIENVELFVRDPTTEPGVVAGEIEVLADPDVTPARPTGPPTPVPTPLPSPTGEFPRPCEPLGQFSAVVCVEDFGGLPGEEREVVATLRANGQEIAAVQVDIEASGFEWLDESVLQCRSNPALNRRASGFARIGAGRVRALILDLVDVSPLSDGVELFRCRVRLDADAAPGDRTVRAFDVAASTPDGNAVLIVGRDGVLRVAPALEDGGDPAPSPHRREASPTPTRPATSLESQDSSASAVSSGCAIEARQDSMGWPIVLAVAFLLVASRNGQSARRGVPR